jgi:hypothetical protein
MFSFVLFSKTKNKFSKTIAIKAVFQSGVIKPTMFINQKAFVTVLQRLFDLHYYQLKIIVE